jgi:hypothetical protein
MGAKLNRLALATAVVAFAGCTLDFDKFAPTGGPPADAPPSSGGDEGGTGGNAPTEAGADRTGVVDGPDAEGPSESGARDGPAAPSESGARDAPAAPSDAGATVPCPEPQSTNFGGHCYFVTTTRGTWDAASTACSAANSAHLVTITSAAEQTAVAGVVGSADRWIGLSRPLASPTVPSSFAWVSGEPFAFSNWDTPLGEPNYTGECVRIRTTGRWADTTCATGTTYQALCERE